MYASITVSPNFPGAWSGCWRLNHGRTTKTTRKAEKEKGVNGSNRRQDLQQTDKVIGTEKQETMGFWRSTLALSCVETH